MIAWVNPPHLPYAPAIDQAGIALERCMVVRPANREDALWAAEQALRSGACGGVLFWLGAVQGDRPRRGSDEYAWLRRLQMAAEAGRAMAVFFRSTAAERLSTPAHLRVVLTREEGVLKLRIPKRRGPPLIAPILLARQLVEERGPITVPESLLRADGDRIPVPECLPRADAGPITVTPDRPRALSIVR
jgi:cell division inhibitor SulA/protein ImuA